MILFSLKALVGNTLFCLHTAMLISGYVTEHPNKEQEAQWQSCLSAIITDCHKNQITSSDDMQRLGKVVLQQFSNDHGKKQYQSNYQYSDQSLCNLQ